MVGLPKYVVLKSNFTGKFLHYLWNDEFGEYYKDIGSKRDVDEVSPFVKFEVVPSSSGDRNLIHLRCSYNNKFLYLVKRFGVSWISATANASDESRTSPTSTLFQAIFPPNELNTVGLLHVQTNSHLRMFYNPDYNPAINYVACVYSNDGTKFQRFEFAAWESYEDKMKKKGEKILKKLKAPAGDVAEQWKVQNAQLDAAYKK